MNGYGKVYHLGSRDVAGILDGEVYVEEKIDGSQFSFGADAEGELWCASRTRPIPLDTEDKLFRGAVDTALRVHMEHGIPNGATFRGEAMKGPRHSKLRYGRAPGGSFVLFDFEDEDGLATRWQLEEAAAAFGLEIAPKLADGVLSRSDIIGLVDGESFLGGCQREGIVVKQSCGGHGRMKAKVVSKAFREKQGAKPRGIDGVQGVVDRYRTNARWDKAIQHVREAGELTGTTKDIGAIMREISRDMIDECEAEIREALWPKIWKEVVRGVSRGAAEYYIDNLGDEQ